MNHYVSELARKHIHLLDEWNFLYKTFDEFINAKALTGRVINHVPDIPDMKLIDLFNARTFGDLSHLDPKKQRLHQKLSSTTQLNGLYRFEYYNFLVVLAM